MTTWPWQVRLDRKLCLAGEYSDPDTTWTLPFTDTTINRIVLSNEFGAPGTILTPDSNDGTSVVIAGDYSAGCCMLGRTYEMLVELTRFFRRRFNGTADLDSLVSVLKVVAAYRESGPFTLKRTIGNHADQELTFTQDDGEISDSSTRILEAWFNGDADNARIFIISESPKPVIVNSIDVLTDEEDQRGDPRGAS